VEQVKDRANSETVVLVYRSARLFAPGLFLGDIIGNYILCILCNRYLRHGIGTGQTLPSWSLFLEQC